MNLPQLPADKANHFLYGCAIAVAGAFAALQAGLDPRMGAIAAAAGFGVGKEVYDKVSKKGTPDVVDAVVTAAGAAPVVLGFLAAAA